MLTAIGSFFVLVALFKLVQYLKKKNAEQHEKLRAKKALRDPST